MATQTPSTPRWRCRGGPERPPPSLAGPRRHGAPTACWSPWCTSSRCQGYDHEAVVNLSTTACQPIPLASTMVGEIIATHWPYPGTREEEQRGDHTSLYRERWPDAFCRAHHPRRGDRERGDSSRSHYRL